MGSPRSTDVGQGAPGRSTPPRAVIAVVSLVCVIGLAAVVWGLTGDDESPSEAGISECPTESEVDADVLDSLSLACAHSIDLVRFPSPLLASAPGLAVPEAGESVMLSPSVPPGGIAYSVRLENDPVLGLGAVAVVDGFATSYGRLSQSMVAYRAQFPTAE